MTDRELLELAAKAAGYVYIKSSEEIKDGLMMINWSTWNPLIDDGDALRLAVTLGISLSLGNELVYAHSVVYDIQMVDEPRGTDQLAATRRAIVRAAAEIGKAMP